MLRKVAAGYSRTKGGCVFPRCEELIQSRNLVRIIKCGFVGMGDIRKYEGAHTFSHDDGSQLPVAGITAGGEVRSGRDVPRP